MESMPVCLLLKRCSLERVVFGGEMNEEMVFKKAGVPSIAIIKEGEER